MRLMFCLLIPVLSAALPLQAETPASSTAFLQGDQTREQNIAEHLLRGAFYYHYLDDNYQQALNALRSWELAAGKTNSESKVMEAAILLALGLDRQAQELYSQVSIREVAGSGNAWFHLARRWLSVGEWQNAEASINKALKLRTSLNDEYYDQALFIQSASRSNLDMIAEAKMSLANMDTNSIWTGLARYNWMLALMRSNANSRDLEKLVEESTFYAPETFEGKALRDRILLVAGIYALDSGKNRSAEAYFKEISQDSAFTAPGLLHYGWALVEQWKYQEAMQPWRILQQKYNDFHPAVVESILGVPHALELLNATTQSLKTYEVVEIRLQRMLNKLEALNQDDAIDAWLAQWLEQQQDQQWGWMRAQLQDMPDSDMTRSLQLMLDDVEFNQLTANLHDLQQLTLELEKHQKELGLWQQILERRQSQLQQAGGKARLRAMEKRHQQLVRKILQMQQKLHAEDEKIFAYASKQDAKNIAHLSSVVPRVEYLQKINTPTRDLSVYKERWRRMRGLQLWTIYEEKPERRWNSNQAYWQLRKDSELLLEQLDNSREALVWADSSWKGFPLKVNTAQRNVSRLQQETKALAQQQQQKMRDMVHEFLNKLEIRLTDYLAQSRLSIARLYDDALQNNVAGGGYDDYQHPTAEDETDTTGGERE